MKKKQINVLFVLFLGFFIIFLFGCDQEKNIENNMQYKNKVSNVTQKIIQSVHSNESGAETIKTTDTVEENKNSLPSEEKKDGDLKIENNIYANKKYNYQIAYPKNRYLFKELAENDFSERGEFKNLVGGDLTISNYNMIEKSKDGPYFPTKNEISIELAIFKIKKETTIENFMTSKELKSMYIPFDYDKRTQEETTINGKKAIFVAGVQVDAPYLPVNHVFIKNNENMFVFTYAEGNSINEIRSEVKNIIGSIMIK